MQTYKTGELRKEYDFSRMSGGVRGKYAERFQSGTNLVKIDPDVARVFTDENSVNDALRSLIKIAERRTRTNT